MGMHRIEPERNEALDEFGFPKPLTCPDCGTATDTGGLCQTCQIDANILAQDKRKGIIDLG